MENTTNPNPTPTPQPDPTALAAAEQAALNAYTAEQLALASLNFDTTPESEQAAIEAVAKELAPKFVIVEKSLAVKFPTNEVIKISLDVPYEKFEQILETSESPSEQFNEILGFLGDERNLNVIRNQGAVAVMATAQKYFTVWEKVVGAGMGESNGSGISA